MSRLTPRSIAIADQILAMLADDPLPISTMGLWEMMRPLSYSDVLRQLNRLARCGEVEKIRLEDMRCCYWRRSL